MFYRKSPFKPLSLLERLQQSTAYNVNDNIYICRTLPANATIHNPHKYRERKDKSG